MVCKLIVSFNNEFQLIAAKAEIKNGRGLSWSDQLWQILKIAKSVHVMKDLIFSFNLYHAFNFPLWTPHK